LRIVIWFNNVNPKNLKVSLMTVFHKVVTSDVDVLTFNIF
jgi:hypothetical protein